MAGVAGQLTRLTSYNPESFMVLDAQHYLRRPVAGFYRGGLGLGDEAEALAMRARFMEIWSASYPGVASTTVGL